MIRALRQSTGALFPRPIGPASMMISFLGLFLQVQVVFGAGGPSIMEKIEHAGQPYDNSAIKAVQPVPMETVTARERYQGGTFRVLARKQAIARYPCTSCHVENKNVARDSGLLTHGDIELHHGQPGALSCIDCHSEENRNVLADKEGNPIDFDHSYQLCGQCHFRQKSDWLGGAHGKRVSYWTGERVIYNCASCHDPHSPRFDKRYPATYSPEMEQRRQPEHDNR